MGNIFQKWGQGRHLLSLAAGFLIAVGTLQITEVEIDGFLDLLTEIVKHTEIIYGLVLQAIAQVASWRSKEKIIPTQPTS